VSFRERPIISIPQSQEALVLNFVALAGLAVILTIAIRSWLALPEIFPIHFDLSGQPNGWGRKIYLWIFPIISIILYGGFTFLNRYPHIFNYPVEITPENAQRQYQMACSFLNWLKVEMIWIFAYTEWMIYYLATSSQPKFGWIFFPLILLIISVFSTTGFFLRQAFLAR